VRLLLLLDLLAPGADRTDAEDLARALQDQDHEVLAVARGPRRLGPAGSHARPARVLEWPGPWGWRKQQRDFQPDAVVIVDGGGSVPRWRLPVLLAGAPVLLWPPAAGHACAWGVDAKRAARGRLGLWDGDYLLSPAPLHPWGGAALLGAFARLGADLPQLDLVVLAPGQPALRRAAEELGVSARVHFAGAAWREAEWAWLEHAAAIVLVPPARVSPGLVMRCWAVGLPPIVAARAGGAAAVETRHPGRSCPAEAEALEVALRQALTRDGAAAAMAEAWRRRAHAMGWERVAAAIGHQLASLPLPVPERESDERAA
jgi:hypothetical protein